MKTRKKNRSAGNRALIQSLEALEQCLRDGVEPRDRFPTHTVYRIPEPGRHSPHSLVRLRKRLEMSQAAFADLLGVSRILVQSWERGVRKPSPLAARLLDTISHDPAGWLSSLRETRRAG